MTYIYYPLSLSQTKFQTALAPAARPHDRIEHVDVFANLKLFTEEKS